MTDYLALKNIMAQIEDDLCRFYEFEKKAFAGDHLVSVAELGTNQSNRASVLASVNNESDEFFLGIFFNDEIITSAKQANLFKRLDQENLDLFCVIAEEVSHFHLLANRAAANQVVSPIELEWQGEIDKFLLSAITLKRQYGDPHYFHLKHRIFHQIKITAVNKELYRNANDYALRFWNDILTYVDGISDPINSQSLKTILQNHYTDPWHKKILGINNFKKAA